jgi:hypothetical protein
VINTKKRVTTRIEIDLVIEEDNPVLVTHPWTVGPVALLEINVAYVNGLRPGVVRGKIARIKNDGTPFQESAPRAWYGRETWPPVIVDLVEQLDQQHANQEPEAHGEGIEPV